MADTNGNPPDTLTGRLSSRPFGFDFFRAVRLLESQSPELPRIGFSYSPSEDPVRFWQNPSLRFAPSTVESFKPGPPGTPPRMAVNFFGLFGTNAPMPPHITEYVLERELHHHDMTITAFFNVFHHRLISLFYRAWAASQKVVDLDRADGQRFATYIGSLFGIGMDTLQERDAVPDKAKLFFAGRLASQIRNAEGLEAILRHYFHLPVELQQFVGRWLDLPDDSVYHMGGAGGGLAAGGRLGDWAEKGAFGRSSPGDGHDERGSDAGAAGRLGGLPPGQGIPASLGRLYGSGPDEKPMTGRLGIDTILGSQFWDCQLSFRLRFGPMSLADYKRMLPNGDSFKRLKYWVLNYCGEHFFWSAQLILRASEVPATKLGGDSGLGWASWLKTKDFARDADDLILHPPND